MELFAGTTIEDTRQCLLAALQRLRDPDAAKRFVQNFQNLERLWEAIAPDPSLYPHRFQYNWLCGIYIAHRRRQRGRGATYGELSAKTRELIEENTTLLRLAESLPVFAIDEDYVTKIDELPSPADKAAVLEAALTAELGGDNMGFTYRPLGERLQQLRERKEAADQADDDRLRALVDIADEAVKARTEPERLNLTRPGEYEVFSVLRSCSQTDEEEYIAECGDVNSNWPHCDGADSSHRPGCGWPHLSRSGELSGDGAGG
jgi:type I restriction enzyme R subunit